MKETINSLIDSEFNRRAYFFHKIIALIAIVFNPLWGIVDYYNIPEYFTEFIVFRISITLATVLTFIYHKKFQNKPEWLVFVPLIGISIQNAYMYNVMEIQEFQKHTFAYVIMFLGAGMFILWRIKWSIVVILTNLIFNIVFFQLLSKLTLNEYITNGGFLTFSIALFSIFLIHSKSSSVKKEIKNTIELKLSNEELKDKKTIIEDQKNDILSSIQYAYRIQQAILPSIQDIDKILSDYFIFYQPKDIISGDFYWINEVNTTPTNNNSEKIVVVAVADSTGHGVPGAMMSVIGSTILNQSLNNKDVNCPSEALDFLNTQLNKNISSINDGMDIALIALNFNSLKMQFAGANNPVYILRNKEIIELKADKQAIGSNFGIEKKFTNQDFQLQKNDLIYLFTDGYADQFGGNKIEKGGKKFKYSRLKQTLIECSELNLIQQKAKLIDVFENWKGNFEQIDDVCIIGVRI
ncbi:MAG: SpoIIE family protein phosphatase [Flavobacteriia bacterium]|nr:SpoIIE family protein phosphatase [Flavobacteriia bacterium]